MPKDTPDAAGIAAREALILGQPPRIAPLAPEAYPQEARERWAKVSRAAGHVGGAEGPHRPALPDHTATMLRHPDLFDAHTTLAIQLLGRGALSPRDRELAILRTGWLCQAPFEWGEHVGIAKRAGLSAEEVERVTQGSAAPGWDEHDRAILRAVEELHHEAMISDATWAVLARRLDERQLIELPLLVGQYHGVAFYQNALRIRPRADNAGLAAR